MFTELLWTCRPLVGMSYSDVVVVTFQSLGNVSNPVAPYAESGWNYMTDNFSEFAILTWISVVFHEVHRDLCIPLNCPCIP